MLKLTMYTLCAWSVALVPGAICAVSVGGRLRRREWSRRWERLLLLLVWIASAWTYYAIVHMGQQGLAFVFLPALLLISAAGLTRLLFAQPRRLIVAAVTLVTVNVVIFCLSPEYPLGGDRLRLLTRAILVNSGHHYRGRFEAIKSGFAPESTAILADHWRYVEYYLPSYPSLHFNVGARWEQDEGNPLGSLETRRVSPVELFGPRQDEQGQMAVVIPDPILGPFNAMPERVEMLPLAHGGILI
jgi:hypothetical protein